MLKHNFTITLKADIQYPHIDSKKNLKKFEKDFDAWLKDWATSLGDADSNFLPTLYETNKDGTIEHNPNATLSVKVVRDKETILDTRWDELSDNF